MMEICGDNRFEIIAKAKAHLLDATNIDTSEDEMKVLDSFLFRCWQMGWLDRYDEPQTQLTAKCLNCVNGGSYKCSKCDGEMYFKDEPSSSEKPNNCEEPQTEYDKGLKLFADILFDKDKSNQFLEECKAMGIEPQTERSV